MQCAVPDFFIMDTREIVLEYLGTVTPIPNADLVYPLRSSGSLIIDTMGIDCEYEYNLSLALYDILGELLYDDAPDTPIATAAVTSLFTSVRSEVRRNGLIDERGFCHYVFYKWTEDHCMILQHFSMANP